MTIHDHDWSHVTHDLFRTMTDHIWSLLMTIKDYHSWLSSMTMNSTYEHHLWPSDLMTYDSSPVSITQDCYPWLSPMTMNITHNLPPLMTSLHHSWLSSLYVTYDCHRSLITRDDYLSPMTLITQDHHQWPWLPFTTRDHDFLLTTSTHALSLMSYHPCLVSHAYLWPSWLMTYDLQLITRDYHIRPSFMTIIHDHHSWPSGLITWLLTHDFSPMAIKVFSPMTMTIIGDFPSHDHHPWACHPPYDHNFSPMTSYPTTMTTLWPWSVLDDHQDIHPWPSEWSLMSTLCLSCG